MSPGGERRRRARGEQSVYWSEERQRFIAEATVGYNAMGKRITRKGAGVSETAALRALRGRIRDYEAGLVVGSERWTVREAVEDWLVYGRSEVDPATLRKDRDLAEKHIYPNLGGRRLRDLRAQEVDRWLHSLRENLATRSLQEVRSCLSRSVRRAMMRGLADRNVVELCQVPRGRPGRPSKSLTLAQVRDVLVMTARDPMHCYIVVSLLTGARTEELRALRWEHVHLDQTIDTPLPLHLEVWCSVRAGGDTKTRRSRRTLALPTLAVAALRRHRVAQAEQRLRSKVASSELGLVFATSSGAALDAANVRRDFRRALTAVPSVVPAEWTPREMRHSFVSVLSESGLNVEEIARLVGHKGGSQVTERVYRKQLRPVIETGATTMDRVFGTDLYGRTGDA